MLDRSEEGNSDIVRGVIGDAAGETGAEGTNLEPGIGIGKAVVSVNRGCTLPVRWDVGDADPVPSRL
jgi:hypothetical protein